MELPMWAVWVGGFFAVIGVITVLCLCPKLIEAVFDAT
jgi:hypothetical protein